MGLSTNGPITSWLNSWAYTLDADAKGHHTYVCFHAKGKLTVRAQSLLDARDQAARHWKLGPRRAHEIAPVLYQKFGEQPRAVHPAEIG